MPITKAIDRSAHMAKIKGSNTKPEIHVRKVLFGLGYRYTLHGRGLPGSPDIVFPARKKVIFVHGCFWHRHDGCKLATTPKTRVTFWREKFKANVRRDGLVVAALRNSGWKPLVLWQCELKSLDLEKKLCDFLGPPRTRKT